MNGLAQKTTKVSFILMVGEGIATIILFFGTLVLIRLLLPNDYGLYAIALLPMNMLQLVRDWGIPLSVQQRISKTEKARAWSIAKAGMAWEGLMGGLLSVLLFLGAPMIAILLNRPEIVVLLVIGVPVIASLGTYKVAYSALIGAGKSELGAMISAGSSILKVVASVGMVLLGYGPMGAMFGFALSSVLTSISALAVLRKHLAYDDTSELQEVSSTVDQLKDLLSFAIPIGAVYFTVSIISNVTQLVSAGYVSNADFGVYAAALVLYGFLSIPFRPLILSLLSMFTMISLGEKDTLGDAFERATRITAVFMCSLSLFSIVLADPLIYIIYGPGFSDASYLFTLMCLAYLLFAPFGSITLSPLMMSHDLTKEFFWVNLITFPLTLLLAIAIVPNIGVVGIVYASIFTVLATTIGLGIAVRKKISISIVNSRNVKLFLALICTLFMGMVGRLLNESMHPLVGWVLPALIVFISLPLLLVRTGAFSLQDAKYIVDVSKGSRITHFGARAILRVVSFVTSHDCEAEELN